MSERKQFTIPRPAGDKEPLKTNLFQFIQTSTVTLAPLFPYFDEGSIVPCVATFRGGPDQHFGRFQHFNTVDEVAIMFGSRAGRGVPGFVRVGPKLHPVGAPLDDEKDPDAIRVVAITQRQLIGQKHREEVRFICEKCDRRLYMEELDATPPKRGRQTATLGAHAPFLTVLASYKAAKNFNANEEHRRCRHCGHVNAPFPTEAWGWDAYAKQTEISSMAQGTLTATQSRRPGPPG